MKTTEPAGAVSQKRIARKLALYILCISMLITILGASFQLYMEYAHDSEEIQKTITNAHNSMEALLRETLWLSDDKLVTVAMQGILAFPHIETVVVQKADGTQLAMGISTAEKQQIHTHEIVKAHRGQRVHLGKVTVTANLDTVFNRLIDRTIFIFGTQALWAILLALAAMWLFHHLVGRHLHRMSKYSQALSIDSLDETLVLEGRPAHTSNPDELGHLVFALNDMRDKLRSSLETLKEREEQYRTLVNTAPYGIQLTDLEGQIIFSNPAHHKIHGYADGELIGKWIWDLTADKAQMSVTKNYYQRIVENQPAPQVYYSKDKTRDGREIDTQIDWDYIRNSRGELVGIISIVSDITAQKNLEALLRQAQRLESIGNLAGGIAHDFNNILFPIVGLAELLMEDLPPDSIEYDNALEILNAAKRGAELVKQILAFSRQGENIKIPVRIQQVLKDVLRLSRSTIPANIDIAQDIQTDCGLVFADPTQLHQVSMNLITNAYHAVEHTGGKITVQLKQVEVCDNEVPDSILDPGPHAILSVCDTGCGIDPAAMDLIFEPYFTTKELGKGTGLGLAVVYGIVKEHQGGITVSSEVGKGTTFTVYLPLLKKAADTKVTEKPQNNATGYERILLVDDENSVVRFEQLALERLGYRVTAYTDSLEAFNAFRENPDAFDLVVTDMTMPKMTGDQLAKKIKPIRPDIPVIICTGYSERINKKQAEAAGISAFLIKPVVKAEMARTVRQVMDGINGSGKN